MLNDNQEATGFNVSVFDLTRPGIESPTTPLSGLFGYIRTL